MCNSAGENDRSVTVFDSSSESSGATLPLKEKVAIFV